MKRTGFSLPLVLIIMAVVIVLSAVIMDMTTNYFGSSQATIEHQKLYNAAQSGLERAKAWLLVNRGSIDKNPILHVDEWTDLIINSDDVDFGDNIRVNSFIFKCNYVPVTSPDISELPPVYKGYYPPGSSAANDGEGQSGYIDPNRNILGVTASGGRVFVIRSTANLQEKNKSTGIEAMVVIPND